MAEEKLIVIHGAGTDSIGLVEKITRPIAEISGNIVDLRQDVLHGLFIISLVVDLAGAKVTVDGFKEILTAIRESTAIDLSYDRFRPIPRDPEKKGLLCILIGEDGPGIGAAIAETLKTYKINIEFSQMVARQHIFLMELLLDISLSSIPLENLKNEITAVMAKKKITALLQEEDIFNKKKRLLVFSIHKSFLPSALMEELCRQTGQNPNQIKTEYTGTDLLEKAGEYLDGVSVDVIEKIVSDIRPTRETQELVQTLKTMGYRIALVTSACDVFAEHFGALLGLDAVDAALLPVDIDDRSISNEAAMHNAIEPAKKTAETIADELGIDHTDITILSDETFDTAGTPGLAAEISLKRILEYINSGALIKKYIPGICGLFGQPE
ncbi:MAG: hypothetical protein JW904_15385 [Spirochaetales bacterium]|nr:hypothetical protein [Spirochaetales bacterium]